LESYYPPLSKFLVSSAPEDYCIHSSLPKIAKSQLVLHCCLGDNLAMQFLKFENEIMKLMAICCVGTKDSFSNS
jgi:hypothetical protein